MKRRTFTHRSTATLASVLAIGLLPSVTRRLKATDISNFYSGVSYVTNGASPAAGQPIASDYRNAKEVQESTSTALAGGTLNTVVHVGYSLAQRACNYTLTLRITRRATYSITVAGVTYTSLPVTHYLVLVYDCQSGSIHKEEEANTHSAPTGEPLKDSQGNVYAPGSHEWRLHLEHSFFDGVFTASVRLSDDTHVIASAADFGTIKPDVICCLL